MNDDRKMTLLEASEELMDLEPFELRNLRTATRYLLEHLKHQEQAPPTPEAWRNTLTRLATLEERVNELAPGGGRPPAAVAPPVTSGDWWGEWQLLEVSSSGCYIRHKTSFETRRIPWMAG